MSFTDPNNIIDPELLTAYATAEYPEAIRVSRSGILSDVTSQMPGISEGSSVLEMPQWESVGEGQTLPAGTSITMKDLNDHRERHPVVRRYNGIQNLDLAQIISKGDPNQEASRQIATSIGRDLNIAAIAALQGCTAANAGNAVTDTAAAPAVTDITALEQVFNDRIEETLGGAGILLMRSAVFYAYKELGLVTAPTVGELRQDQTIEGLAMMGVKGALMGHLIIVDDELYRAGLTSKTTGDALTYLVGQGALITAVQKALNIETDRDIKTKSTDITWDVHQTMGVKGIDYTATVAKSGPESSDLRTSGNWALVAEDAVLVPSASIQTNHP